MTDPDSQPAPFDTQITENPWSVLVLSRFPEKIVPSLARFDDQFLFNPSERVTLKLIERRGIDHIVCFGYGHVLGQEVLSAVDGAVNVHWSLLPFCRGPYPHIWSILDEIPFATSVHFMEAEVDSGDLIAQAPVELDTTSMTLQQVFDALVDASADLFNRAWAGIRTGVHARLAQPPGGSFHTRRDMEPLQELMTEEGTELTVAEFRTRALRLLGRS